MGTDSGETNPALDEPTWLERLRPRTVGSRCWDALRLERETHGRLAGLSSYVPAILVTVPVVVVAAILHALGYALTRPDATTGED